jgi:hypothetical protein
MVKHLQDAFVANQSAPQMRAANINGYSPGSDAGQFRVVKPARDGCHD